jgi:hypothetical protein
MLVGFFASFTTFAAMQQQSPEKYITTRARTLPIFKCLVNEGWETSKMAQVIVMRRHVTGNVTIGLYLVDLLCLGVKDTHYYFNILPNEFEERIEDGPEFTEISYELAHNIVYAGHDFAMEFTIKPCADFALTQYILEEDNDHIPLIDISTGDGERKPHLMVHSGSNYHDALARLRQHAGEGNYHYTIGIGNNEDEAGDELFAPPSLDDFEQGSIDAITARAFDMETLLDMAGIEKRSPTEIIAMGIETRLRMLEISDNGLDIIGNESLENLPEFEMIKQAKDGLHTENGFLLWDDVDNINYLEDTVHRLRVLNDAEMAEAFDQLPPGDQQNPLLAIFLYEKMLIMAHHYNDKASNFVVGILQQHVATYPMARLYFDFNTGCNKMQPPFGEAAMSNDITDYLPAYPYYGNYELQIYWLIKVLRYAAADDLANAAKFYKLAVEAQPYSEALFIVQFTLFQYLNDKLRSDLYKSE